METLTLDTPEEVLITIVEVDTPVINPTVRVTLVTVVVIARVLATIT